jgi:hypothetical protein
MRKVEGEGKRKNKEEMIKKNSYRSENDQITLHACTELS